MTQDPHSPLPKPEPYQRLRVKGYSLANPPAIKVEVTDHADGAQTISVIDEGTGMSWHVIENYLSVVGASYYQSREFRKLGLKLDPISRFGIGILSCFGVGSKVDIVTHTDPACEEHAESWSITIKSNMQFWSIAKGATEGAPGTTVRVHVPREQSKRLLRKYMGKKCRSISEYLQTIVGMTDVPIVITEAGETEVIVGPMLEQAALAYKQFRGVKILALPKTLPLNQLFEAPDVDFAENCLEVVTVDLADFGIQSLTGYFSYLIPKNDWRVSSVSTTSVTLKKGDEHTITLHGNQRTRSQPLAMASYVPVGFAPSLKCDPFVRCYTNGILIPEVVKPKVFDGYGKWQTAAIFGMPWLQVNLTGDLSPTLSMDRGRIKESEKKYWDEVVLTEWCRFQAKCHRDKMQELSPAAKMKFLIELWNYHWVSLECFAEFVDLDEWPVAIIDESGRLDVKLWREVKNWAQIPLAPRFLTQATKGAFVEWLLGNDHRRGPRVPCNWQGERCIIEIVWDGSLGLRCPRMLSEIPLHKSGLFKEERFIEGPELKLEEFQVLVCPPLKQTVFRASTKPANNGDEVYPGQYLLRIAQAPKSATNSDLNRRPAFMGLQTRFARGQADSLTEALSKAFCWGQYEINVDHPLGELFCQIVYFTEYRAWNASRDDGPAVELQRAVRNFHELLAPVGPYASRNSPRTLTELSQAFEKIVRIAVDSLHLISFPKIPLRFSSGDFLPCAFPECFCNGEIGIVPISLEGDALQIHKLQKLMNHPKGPFFGRSLY